ncbi:DUF3761 domain-containing protein [Nocardia brasiliensis]|uniref:DUF3761 domain-containing protein n=1 Tax=Nocardia brasiliensis TaxID=37326 RepID=UPI002453CDD5|nr:DUF3761 domain-containing protein [Nocardia brasiliensis]
MGGLGAAGGAGRRRLSGGDRGRPDHPALGTAQLLRVDHTTDTAAYDGTYSFSQHRSGTCSGHKGVDEWLVDLPK